MTQLSEIQGNHVLRITIQTAMASATTDDEFLLATMPTNGTLVSAKWVPAAAVTANGTNFSILSIRNRTTAAGSALPFTRTYAATNSVAFTAEAMTASATAADLTVASGDLITVQRIHTASGVIVPGGLIEVSYKIR